MEQVPWNEAYATSLKHLRYEHETTLGQARLLEFSSNAKQICTKNSSESLTSRLTSSAAGRLRFARLGRQS